MNNNCRTFATALGCFHLMFLASTNVVHAQSGDQTLTLEEIIVTARKRDESIADIPISITAFSADQIESLGLQAITDLPAVTPGFVYEEFSGIPGRFDNSPRFRGVAVNSLAPTRQTASIFVDGIFVAGGVQGIGFEDVERIEIIKGPQSAFFGRNTFGGAINYITKTPGDEFGGRISVLAATESEYGFDGSLDIPISDSVRARVVGSYKDKGAHYESSVDGGETGEEETTAFGATLFFTPSDNFDAKIRGYYFENEDGPAAYYLAGLADHNCGPFGGTDTTICGDTPVRDPGQNTIIPDAVLTLLDTLTPLHGSHRTKPGLDRESYRISAQFNYDFPGTNMTLSVLLGLNKEDVRLFRDADDTPDLEFFAYSGREFKDNSQEIRLSGLNMGERLKWSVGANFFDQEFSNNGEFIAGSGAFAFGSGEPSLEEIETQGVFASVGYQISDALNITLEGRYQEDEVTDDDDITDDAAAANGTFDNFLPRAILEWRPVDDTLLYVSYSKGNLPGGFNGEVAELSAAELAELRAIQSNAADTFDEEELESYEIGMKSTFMDGRLAVNAAVFRMDRSEQAFRRADVIDDGMGGENQIDYFINAGEAEITGVELDGRFALTGGFELAGTFAFIESEYTVFNSGNINEVFGSEDASGQTAERFPEIAASLSAIFNGELTEGIDWFARGDLFYTDERFADEINLTTAEASTILNLRAGVSAQSYRVELYVSNATDSDEPTAINRFRDLSTAGRAESVRITGGSSFSTFGYQAGLRDMRQIGLRASYNF